MKGNQYELVTEVDGFTEGDRVEVTARYGGWHVYDVRLEPRARHRTGSIQLTEDRLGTVAERVTET